MYRKLVLILYKLVFAALVLFAIGTQLVHSLLTPSFDIGNFFSFFTIESNIFATTLFLLSACMLFLNKKDPVLDYVRGAATTYMLVTGIIYVTLLAGLHDTLLLPWVNSVLHYLFPVVVLLDWLLDPPTLRLSYRKALLWLTYPLVYLTYSLLRGAGTHWYPYPFIDISRYGYGRVAIQAAVISVGVILLICGVASLPRLNRRHAALSAQA